jgi:hypothetical protein
MVFAEVGDPLPRQLPAGVATRHLGGKASRVPYGIAVRPRGSVSAPALALIKAMMRYAEE